MATERRSNSSAVNVENVEINFHFKFLNRDYKTKIKSKKNKGKIFTIIGNEYKNKNTSSSKEPILVSREVIEESKKVEQIMSGGFASFPKFPGNKVTV